MALTVLGSLILGWPIGAAPCGGLAASRRDVADVQPGTNEPGYSAQATTAASSALEGVTVLRLSGTLESYDPRAESVSVSTVNGIVRLLLTPTSRIRHGRQTVDASILKVRRGSRVVLRYLDSARGHVVLSLNLLDGKAGGTQAPGQSG